MSKTVLIADDNASIRYLIRSLVESAGFTVCAEAENGTRAIEKAKQSNPDLILLDLAMPGTNGAEASSVLKRIMPRVPIILFTLHENSIGKSLADAVGADLVISKTAGINKLVDAMNELMDRSAGNQSCTAP